MSLCTHSSRPSTCTRCQLPAKRPATSGWLHLQFPTPHAAAKVMQVLQNQHQPTRHQDNLISLALQQEDVESLLPLLAVVLTPLEQEDVKVLFQPFGKVMELHDYFAVESLQRFLARHQSSWLVGMIEHNRLYSLFQPIIDAQSTASEWSVFAYECLLRGRQDQRVISPNRLFEAARHAGLVVQLDVAARFAAIRAAAEHHVTQKIFINFLPSSIYDPASCLQSTMRLLDSLGLQRHQVVFEVVESDRVDDTNHLRSILDVYRDEGFEVALDDLGAGYSSLNLLHELRPDYLKLDMGLTLGVHQDPYKALIAQKLLETAQLLGVKTIAEGVETQEEFHWLRKYGVSYVQGFYFAKPAVPPPFPQVAAPQRG